MIEKGMLFTCDVCNKNGSFVNFDDKDSFPDGWAHLNGNDICPDCLKKASEDDSEEKKEERKIIPIKNGIPW